MSDHILLTRQLNCFLSILTTLLSSQTEGISLQFRISSAAHKLTFVRSLQQPLLSVSSNSDLFLQVFTADSVILGHLRLKANTLCTSSLSSSSLIHLLYPHKSHRFTITIDPCSSFYSSSGVHTLNLQSYIVARYIH